jgi:flagella basal body P-ring formation protein FlgA
MNYSLSWLVLLASALGVNRPPAAVHTVGPAALAVPAAVITFRSAAEVSGKTIRLSDVALVESADAHLAARLESIEVGSAPLCGHSRTVSAEYARIRVRQIGVDPSRIEFRGENLITVNRPDQRLAGSEIVKVAQAAAESANPGTSVEIDFVPRDIRLPVGALVLKPQPVKLVGESGGSVTIQVLVAGLEEATVPLSFRLHRRAPVVVAARDLPAGAVLSADDVHVEERPAQPGRLALSDPAEAVGQQAALPIRAGAILSAAQLKPAILIKRGARIRLVCKGPSFVATAAGEALQDGAAGQAIRVRNLSSLKELTGLVIDDQTTEVPF